jgi:hypothetical protein
MNLHATVLLSPSLVFFSCTNHVQEGVSNMLKKNRRFKNNNDPDTVICNFNV